MTLKECYETIGGDYNDVFGRMMQREALVLRFLKKFLEDRSYTDLKDDLAAGNIEEAFRAAHTLKGVAQNLGLTRLYVPVEKVTNILREGKTDGVDELMVEIADEYDKTVAVISQL
jgi:HPt (histidine-containing phosphotransfer) domain-containing protein